VPSELEALHDARRHPAAGCQADAASADDRPAYPDVAAWPDARVVRVAAAVHPWVLAGVADSADAVVDGPLFQRGCCPLPAVPPRAGSDFP